MKEPKFKIGDRVVVGNNRVSGEVMECLYSTRSDEWLYELSSSCGNIGTYAEHHMELAPVKKEYHIEMEIADNVVICKLIDVTGGKNKEISRGHGHVIHMGDIGIGQAASYAAKQMYIAMNGGSYV